MNKLLSLINNSRKKTMLFFVLYLGFLAQGDLTYLLFEVPDFSKLIISEGKIKIYKGQGRVRDAFTLVINKQEILFSCGINACLRIDKTPEYQGKTAKVWWHKSKDIGLMEGDNFLYQLEINGKIILNYQDQAKRYLSIKNISPSFNLVFFIISMIFFFLLQFANDPIISQRNEK